MLVKGAPGNNEVILKDMGKIDHGLTNTQHQRQKSTSNRCTYFNTTYFVTK